MADFWPKNRSHVPRKLMDPIAQFSSARRWHKPAPGAYKQGIARYRPKARQRPAHGGRTQAKTPGSAGHTAFGEQRIQCDEKVQVHIVHGPSVTHLLHLT